MGRVLPLFLLFATSCSSLISLKKHELQDDTYVFKQKGESRQKAEVVVDGDSVRITTSAGNAISPQPGVNQLFLKSSFDLDIIAVAFKFRPASQNLPRQLNTDFNGNVYMGYRVDRFLIKPVKTLSGIKKKNYHSGFSIGGFAGIGSTFISPWTTNNQQPDEYEGFILSRGVSGLVAINSLTVGIGVGWDYLTDRDKNIWIYQNKPWVGLTLGLNLN